MAEETNAQNPTTPAGAGSTPPVGDTPPAGNTPPAGGAGSTPPGGSGKTGTESKKKRSSAHKVTFVYSVDGEISLGTHETNACSVPNAFEEYQGKTTNVSDAVLIGAIRGHHKFMDDHIRKPTYEELEAMLKAKK